MKKLQMLFILMLIVGMQGCVTSAVKDAVNTADKQVRLKWSEEWKPALIKEMRDTVVESKEAVLKQSTIELAKLRKDQEDKLKSIGVKVENFDANNDGKISGAETLALVREIKAKNDKSKDPLSWWEILAAVGAAYLPLTGAKEMAKSKISKPGNGGVPV